MKSIQLYIASLSMGVFCAGLTGYHLLAANRPLSATAETVSTNQAAPSPQSETAKSRSDTEKNIPVNPINNSGNLARNNNNNNTIALNIYYPDSQCETLIPKKVAVAANTPVTTAVGKVLEIANSRDFPLAGYRVNLDINKRIVTIDLRLSPNSQRQFVSLSVCEQFALFGSLRQTLIGNPQLNIKDVRFTESGREIRL